MRSCVVCTVGCRSSVSLSRLGRKITRPGILRWLLLGVEGERRGDFCFALVRFPFDASILLCPRPIHRPLPLRVEAVGLVLSHVGGSGRVYWKTQCFFPPPLPFFIKSGVLSFGGPFRVLWRAVRERGPSEVAIGFCGLVLRFVGVFVGETRKGALVCCGSKRDGDGTEQ